MPKECPTCGAPFIGWKRTVHPSGWTSWSHANYGTLTINADMELSYNQEAGEHSVAWSVPREVLESLARQAGI